MHGEQKFIGTVLFHRVWSSLFACSPAWKLSRMGQDRIEVQSKKNELVDLKGAAQLTKRNSLQNRRVDCVERHGLDGIKLYRNS